MKQEANYPPYVRNAIRTPDGAVIYSRHRHDYQTHVDANGKEYMVDGGLDYLRRSVHPDAPYEELAVASDQPFEIVREALEWGTRGVHGDQPVKYVKMSDLHSDHIYSILDHIRIGVKVKKPRHASESMNMKNDLREASGLSNEDEFIVVEHPSKWLIPFMEEELAYRKRMDTLYQERENYS